MKSELFQIQWKGKPEWVRPGAKVESLLSEDELEYCRVGRAIIRDSKGFEVGLTGALNQGEQLTICYLNETNSQKNT